MQHRQNEQVDVEQQRGSFGVDQARERDAALARAALRIESRLGALGQPVAQPVLIGLCGLPGSGKSYLARHLQPHLSATIIETDFVRRILFPKPLYSSAENGWVYAVCHELIAGRLQNGQHVIFDATNLLEHSRQDLSQIARRAQARFVIVHVIAANDVIRERLQQRAQRVDPRQYSDADMAVYEKLRETEQPIRQQHLVINTTLNIEQNIARILRECQT